MHQPQLSKQVDYPFSDENDSDDKKDDDSLPDTSQQELHLETAIFASYLKKRSERGKAWKRRWFVLRPTRLSYYKNDQEYELHNIVRLDTIHAIGPIDAKKKEYAFGIVCKERTYYLQASSQEEMLEWISQLKKAIKGVYGSQQLSPRRESATKPESIRSSIVESILTTVSQPSAIESPLQVLAEPSPLEPLARDSDGLLQIVTEEQKKDAIIHQGFLYRLKGGLPRQWKNYWCVLRTRSMTLYRDEKVSCFTEGI
ncbi:hypothetical protein EDD86DRAFT_61251 [Gorgonomyces haynaldii]|nr:hypothetical protein EDD86DRAFT_61251 [Gorgonomyces haynaldii]